MLSGHLDELVDVFRFLLQDALGFHLVAVHEIIDQPRCMIFTAEVTPSTASVIT